MKANYLKTEEGYRNIICNRFCFYYKPGKEEFSCRAFDLLKASLTLKELQDLVEGRLFTELLIEPKDICKKCNFRFDDCDFFAGLSANSCGGYSLLNKLKERANTFSNL